MILSKWNNEKEQYEPYNVNDDWNVKLYSNNMNEIVNCPHCGKRFRYGDGYTSLEIHNEFGLGYSVCSKCYKKEWERRK